MAQYLRPVAQRLVVKPAIEPLDLATVKSYLRIEQSIDDAFLSNLVIPAARFQVEKITGEQLITQTWEMTYSGFPLGYVRPSGVPPIGDVGWSGGYADGPGWLSESFTRSIELTKTPVQSVSITYLDCNGVLQTFGTYNNDSPPAIIEWSLIQDDNLPRIILNQHQRWPLTAPVWNAVKIQVVAGYGDAGSDVPSLYLMGMGMLCGHFNENRESVVIEDSRAVAIEVPLGIRDLLATPKVG